jgi:hypothetical protein
VANYKEQALDPRWQKRRLEILQRDNFECQGCKEKTKTLHVHHWYYETDRDYWDYPDSALSTFCEDCHEHLTERDRLFRDGNLPKQRIAHLTRLLCDNIEDLHKYAFVLISIISWDGSELVNKDVRVNKYDEITGYDLIESALYNRIPYCDYRDYKGWCIACGGLLSRDEYYTHIKEVCSFIAGGA